MKKENQIVPVESVKTATVEGEVGKEPFGILGFQHEGSVWSIAFSHDSKYIAAGGEDKKLTVYDLTSKAKVHEFQHEDCVVSIAFSHDSKYIAAGGRDNKLTVYDLTSKAQVHEFQHKQSVYSIAFSHDSKYIAAGGSDKKLTVYDLTSKAQVYEFQHEKSVFSIAFSHDSKYIAAGGGDRKLTVYDLTSKAQVHEFQHEESVLSIAFSHDSKYIAAGGYDKKLTVYDLTSKAQVHEFQHEESVESIAFSHDSKYIAAGGGDNKLTVYDLTSKAQVHEFQHEKSVLSIAFSHDSKYIAAGGADNKLTVYDLTSKAQVHEFQHKQSVYSIAFSHDSKYIAAGGDDNKLTVYDLTSKAQVHEFQHEQSVRSIAFSHDSKYIAAGGGDKKLTVYDLTSKAQVHEFQHEKSVFSIAFSHDSKYIAAGGLDMKLTVYDLTSKAQVHEFQHDSWVRSIAFSHDSKYIAAGGEDNKLTVYDLTSKAQVHEFQHEYCVNSIAFSHDSKYIAAGGEDKKLTVYDLTSKAQVHEFQHEHYVNSIAFSHDSKYIAAGGRDEKLTVYDLTSKAQVHEFQHEDRVNSIAFSHDSKYIAAGGLDNKLTVYCPDLAHPEEILLTGLKPLSTANSSLLYRPHPSTKTTLLHRCVSEGGPSLLRDITNPIALLPDGNGNTPLDLAIEQKSHEKCLLLTKACCKESEYTTESLVHSLPALLDLSYHDVVEHIYGRIMKKTNTNRIPRFTLTKPLFKKFPGCPPEPLFTGKTGKDIVEVQTYRIELATMFEKTMLINLLENASLKTFQTKAMQYIVTYLWDHLLKVYLRQCIVYLLGTSLFTFGHFTNLFKPDTIWFQTSLYFLMASGIIILWFVLSEMRHIARRGVRKHFNSGWNRYELISYSLALTSVATKNWLDIQYQEVVHSVAVVLMLMGTFNKIRGFQKFSVLITTFTQILLDIRAFMVMLGIIIFAFTMGFKVLYRGDTVFSNFEAFETVYNMMYGLTEMEFFLQYGDVVIGTTGRIFISVFLFFVVIVMLNMLIAIMADSFDNVQENLQIQSFKAKARVSADLLIDLPKNHSLFATMYLHICTVKDDAAENAIMTSQNQWEGRLKAVKNEIAGVERKLEANQAKVEVKLAKMEAKLAKIESNQASNQAKMEAQLSAILQALQKKV